MQTDHAHTAMEHAILDKAPQTYAEKCIYILLYLFMSNN